MTLEFTEICSNAIEEHDSEPESDDDVLYQGKRPAPTLTLMSSTCSTALLNRLEALIARLLAVLLFALASLFRGFQFLLEQLPLPSLGSQIFQMEFVPFHLASIFAWHLLPPILLYHHKLVLQVFVRGVARHYTAHEGNQSTVEAFKGHGETKGETGSGNVKATTIAARTAHGAQQECTQKHRDHTNVAASQPAPHERTRNFDGDSEEKVRSLEIAGSLRVEGTQEDARVQEHAATSKLKHRHVRGFVLFWLLGAP